MDASGHLDLEQWEHPTLELGGADLAPPRAQQIAQGLLATDMVKYLGLRDTDLGDEGVVAIMEGMCVNRSVEILDISNNCIGDEGARAIAAMLRVNTTLQSLLLTKNKIRKAGADEIAAVLAENQNRRLKKLNLSCNKLREPGAASMATMLLTNTSLQMLDLSRNEVNVGGGRRFAEALKVNTTVQSLRLGNNLIGASVVAFGPALTINDSVLELDLENNIIHSDHAKEFGDQLTNATLMTLNLANNPLGDAGLAPILARFKEQCQLRYLDLSNTGITSQSMDEVATVLRLCPMLETLELDGNNIGAEGVNLLAASMKNNHSLTSLNVDRCSLGTTAMVALSLALHEHVWFESLVVSRNNVTDDACRSLCFALKRLTMMSKLDLSYNDLTSSALEDLSAVFVNNPKLSEIQLQGNPLSEGPKGLALGVLSRRVAVRILDGMDSHTRSKLVPQPAQPQQPRHQSLPSLRPNSPLVSGSGMSSSSILQSVLQDTSGRPASVSALGTLPPSLSPSLPPSRAALIELSSGPPSVIHGEQRALAFLSSQRALMEEEEERVNGTYPALIPSKDSLEDPYYPGWGKGRFSNSGTVQSAGDPVPYTIANSRGPLAMVKDSEDMSFSNTLFRDRPKRVHKMNPYSVRRLERNPGGLLVTEGQLWDAFQELDTDGNNYLDKEEFQMLYNTFENFGVQMNPNKVDDALRQYKAWDDGKITFDEFCVLMLNVAQR